MASILRTARVGWEMEFFLLDEHGRLANKANELFGILEKEGYPHARKEISKFMVEIGADAKEGVRQTAISFFDRIEKLVEITEKHDYKLLPLATYPGKTAPELNDNSWYRGKKWCLVVGY